MNQYEVEPTCRSTSTPPSRILPQHSPRSMLTAAAITAVSLTASTTSALPHNTAGLSGGYLTSPPSRNFVAYTSNNLLPNAARPLSSLPQLESNPHLLVSSHSYAGGTCGSGYDAPLSRMQTLLPLDVQSSYTAGGEIEVTINTFGIDEGGHYEFHLCPLTYPEVPTWDCFVKYPLEFVEDVYYGGVRDERYPERVYLPLSGAFDNNSFEVVRDDKTNPGWNGEMMEFKYVLKLPSDEALVSRLESGGDAVDGDVVTSNSQGVSQEGDTVSSFGDLVANSQGLGENDQEITEDSSFATQFIEGSSSSSNLGPGKNRFLLHKRRLQTTGLLEKENHTKITNITNPLNSTLLLSSEGKQQWYATQVDSGYTVSSVATVPISSIVTDGNGTTTIFTLDGVTVLTGGAAIPASMTTTWGDAAIYGEGIDLAVLDRPPPPPATTEAPEVAVESESSETSTTTTSTSNMLNPAVNDVKPSTQDNNKYVLLRWHYQTSSNCYPKGYDTYSWPSEWGDWTEPSLGQCQDDSNQKNYWNCAEIKILPPQEGKEDMTTNSESKLPPPPPPPQENQAPQAMPDMILVGMNELAHLNVLANDTDPNGDELHLMEVTEAQHGYVALLAGKTELIYAPDHDFEGLDTFECTVCDAYGHCDIAKIDVLVGSNSDLVFAKDDRVVTTGTDPVIVDVTANDVLQRDGQPVVQSIDPLIVAEASGTRRGTCKITSSNKIRYQASEAFLASQAGPGLDKCKYTVCLGEKSKVCDEGWLTIKILPAEDQEDTALAQISTPESLHNNDGGNMHVLTSNIGSTGSGDILAIDDNAVTDSHDEPFTINVLKNDEYEGTPYLTDVTQAASGKCSLTDDNQVLYTPTPGFTGWDRCQYIVCVEDDVCDEGQIKIQVIILPQDTSFSSNIVTTTDKGTVETARPLVINVIANDVKVGSSQPLIVTGASSALHGGCVVTDDNKVEYISEKGFTGWDRCQYTVCAGKTCNVGQIGVKVTPEGSNPVADVSPGALQPNSEELTDAVDLSVSIAKSDAVTVEAGKTVYLDVLANDIKPDGEWTIKSVTEPTAGHAQIVFGRVEYTPVDHFVGLDSFEYTVCDEHENCDSASIVVTVASSVPSGHQDNSLEGVTIKDAADAVVNHGEEISSPQVFAEDDEATVISSNIVLVDAAANDISLGGQSLSISSVSEATHGTCVVSPDNKIEYTAPEEFVGFDRCTYLVCADGECDQGRIEFTVLTPATETIVPPSGENASPVDGITIATLEGAENTPTSDEDVQSSFGGITVMSEPVKIVTDSNRVYADNDSVITAQNVAILVDVTANDSVEEIDDLAITHVGGSKHGNCVIEGIKVRYMPSENFIGHDRCGYVVCEDSICDEGIIRIQVIADESALKHVKHDMASSASLSGSVGSTKSSPVKLCWQAALYDVRRLRGNSFKSNHKLVGKNRHLEANAQSSCVGPSLVTRVINPTQTITYTSTYHAKDNGSVSTNTRSVDMHSKIRSASTSQGQGPYIETRISLSATEDATVMPGFPDLNFGSSQSMLVSSESSTSGRRDAFLKFDTSSVDKSVCRDGIVDAKVTIYSLQGSAQGGTFLTIPNSVEWKEEDLTWSNAPSSNGIVLESLGRVNGRTYYDIDVSSAVKLGLPLSLHILAGEQSDVSAQYATRDHTDSSLHPMLLISCISDEELELDQ